VCTLNSSLVNVSRCVRVFRTVYNISNYSSRRGSLSPSSSRLSAGRRLTGSQSVD